jgi:hypothetical protein
LTDALPWSQPFGMMVRRQLLLADPQQNLNGRLQDRVYTCGRMRLDRRFSWLRGAYCLLRQMRTSKLKLSSSKHVSERYSDSITIGDSHT